MNIRSRLPKLPEIHAEGVSGYMPPEILARWDSSIKAADDSQDANSISILEPIGYDPWTGGGVTARRINGALRSIGAKKQITVNINSPGGDVFEGLAIYNMLREYDGDIQVKVLGLAASAASVIAMAGDNVQIARAGFLMIHNAWVVGMGDKNDLRKVADTLEPIDSVMAEIYSIRSGIDEKKISNLMDEETWITGSSAVKQGFADSLLASDEVGKDEEGKQSRAAAYKLDAALARAGLPRSERRELLSAYAAMPRAGGGSTMPRAGDDDMPRAVVEALSLNLNDIQSLQEVFDHGNQ